MASAPAAAKSAVKRRATPAFTEAPFWAEVKGDWRRLHGNFRETGYSIEWHDFKTDSDLKWSRAFHPDSVEICLNLAGSAQVSNGKKTLPLVPGSAGFYGQGGQRLGAMRKGGEHHRFVTVEFSLGFLEARLERGREGIDQTLRDVFDRQSEQVSAPRKLASAQQQLALSLGKPPVYKAAQELWAQAKALELAATFFYQPLAEEELFCQRHKRVSHERVSRVIALLKTHLAEPPSLESLGQQVGCSPFYLSRIFTVEMGKSISAYLRDLRMERAAELLRTGKYNVTEVALEVGYNSLSHFSATFHAVHGCCPGLYPLPLRS